MDNSETVAERGDVVVSGEREPDYRLTIRLSHSEKAQLRAVAQRQGENLSTVLRDVLYETGVLDLMLKDEALHASRSSHRSGRPLSDSSALRWLDGRVDDISRYRIGNSHADALKRAKWSGQADEARAAVGTLRRWLGGTSEATIAARQWRTSLVNTQPSASMSARSTAM